MRVCVRVRVRVRVCDNECTVAVAEHCPISISEEGRGGEGRGGDRMSMVVNTLMDQKAVFTCRYFLMAFHFTFHSSGVHIPFY